ncbi:MAG: dicarboxylate/amino acid:cation symporter [Candidatus Omnitrophica bacterium]|nr:dicarboxylate/amino acid:cation symporter [Candidatus Omnitrophota bacterium]
MAKAGNKIKFKADWLLSPWAIFAGIFLGSFIGVKFSSLARNLIPLGEIFLALLQMCVIPILVTAVISSVARLITTGLTGRYIGRLVMIIVAGLVVASLVGLAFGFLGKPGLGLEESSRVTLGKLISQYEMESTGRTEEAPTGLMGFFKRMVPANVFNAFTHGQTLSILFFCILFGIALGFVRTPSGKDALSVIEALYEAFQKLFGWIMYILPFGLFCLFAAQISQVGFTIFKALFKFVGLCYLGAVVLIIFYNCLIWWRKKGSFFKPLIALRETLVVAFGTSSSFAAIPSALRCLQNNLNVSKGTTNLVFPLGININPQGSVMYFALSTILIAQIYNVTFGFQAFVIALIGSILAGMAATGVPGAGALSILALILGPLGLPAQTAIILLIAIDPIMDPILTVINVHANCAATVLADEEGEEKS